MGFGRGHIQYFVGKPQRRTMDGSRQMYPEIVAHYASMAFKRDRGGIINLWFFVSFRFLESTQ